MVLKKILYTATDIHGKEVSSFIDTNSNKEAIELLSEKGFTNIRFHDDIATAIDRNSLDNLSDTELERIAKFEAAIRVKPRFMTFIIEVFRVNKILIISGVCLSLWGLYDANRYLIAIGLILSLSMPLRSIWNYRVVNGYDKLLRAYARGQIEAATRQTEFLKKYMQQPEMAFDLDIRISALNASHGDLNGEIVKLKSWRDCIDDLSPGMYESRVASVYHLSGNYDKYVDSIREAFFKSSQSPTLILDLALAEARLGEIDKAEMLLKQVEPDELPIHGVPFVDWAEGMVEYRKGDSRAEEKLSSAVSGLFEFSENPAVWPSLAVCIGDYALCVAADTSIDKAKVLLTHVWEILRFHGEKKLINQLLNKYPNLNSKSI